MNQLMGRRNQIELFVRFKADRSLQYLQYDPYDCISRCFFGFGDSQTTKK